jgi:hypothetical protein
MFLFALIVLHENFFFVKRRNRVSTGKISMIKQSIFLSFDEERAKEKE